MFSVSKHGTIGTTKFSEQKAGIFCGFSGSEIDFLHWKPWTIGTTFFESLEIKLSFFFVFDVQNLELLALLFFELIFQDSVKALFFYDSELGTIGTTISNLTICKFFSYNNDVWDLNLKS